MDRPWRVYLWAAAIFASLTIFTVYMWDLANAPDTTSRDNASQARIDCAQHGGVQQIADYYEFVVTCKDGTVVGHDG